MKKILAGLFVLSFSPLFAEPSSVRDTLVNETVAMIHHPLYKPKTPRLIVLGGGHLVGLVLTYDQTQKSWGGSTGKFHLKNDWSGEGLAQNDEVSHLAVGYVLTKQFHRAYRWAGFSPKKSRTYGALEAALLLTLVEFPMDAFNPTQGFGVADLVFDYAGVGLGLLQLSRPGNWDVKVSAKSNPFSSQEHLFAQTAQQFDNFIFWCTYRPDWKWGERQPVSLGLGYSTRRDTDGLSPLREFRLGVGTTIPDLVRSFAPNAARYFEVLDFYYFNLNLPITIK
ncbi:MAG: hypothetical protein L0196_08910 [candidate division Zixibacteria bacterium]|nr:hypothetical protein [candidate division Zixibacteria bacterium]